MLGCFATSLLTSFGGSLGPSGHVRSDVGLLRRPPYLVRSMRAPKGLRPGALRALIGWCRVLRTGHTALRALAGARCSAGSWGPGPPADMARRRSSGGPVKLRLTLGVWPSGGSRGAAATTAQLDFVQRGPRRPDLRRAADGSAICFSSPKASSLASPDYRRRSFASALVPSTALTGREPKRSLGG